MKKNLFLLVFCLLSTPMLAQFSIERYDFAISNNLATQAATWVNYNTMQGIFRISPAIRYLDYSSITYLFLLTLICTKSVIRAYSYMNISSTHAIPFFKDTKDSYAVFITYF